MTKESQFSNRVLGIPTPLFKETFNDEQTTRKNGGTPTNITYSNGVATFSSTVSKIFYSSGINSTVTLRFKLKDIEIVNGRFLVDFRVGADTLGYVWITGSLLSVSSGTPYIDGVNTNVITSSSKEVVVSNISVKTNGFYIGGSSSSCIMDVDLFEIYPGELSAEQVANLSGNSYNKGSPLVRDTLNPSKTFPTVEGTGSYSLDQLNIDDEIGVEQVVNGTFDTDLTGWNEAGVGTKTWDNGRAKLEGVQFNQIRQNVPVTAGKTYLISADLEGGTTGIDLFVSTYTYVESVSAGNSGRVSFSLVAATSNLQPQIRLTGTGIAYADNVSVEEILPLPHIDSGYNYLKCDSAGTKAFVSEQAYGTWEFDINRSGAPDIFFINDKANKNNGYLFRVNGAGILIVQRITNGVGSDIFFTSSNYVLTGVFYSIKITRTIAGVFTVYIKGGSFGDDYAIVSTTGGSGLNPVTDNTHTTSNYFVMDLDANDEIGQIEIKAGIDD